MIELLIYMAISMLSGALFGLIPFFVGKYMRKPGLGRLGWKWTMVSGLLFLQAPTAIGFVVAIIVRERDYYPRQSGEFYQPAQTPRTPEPAPAAAYMPRGNSLGITCLSGPMRGCTYAISDDGIMLGREHDCAIRFDANTPGISRHHCSLRRQNGALMLTDLSSAYGTYLADGRKLPPQYPTQIAVGSRFYLADNRNLFQIIIMA